MDISIYSKLINKIARQLKNGKLKQNEVPKFIEKELGIKLGNKESLIDMDLVRKRREEQIFTHKYNELSSTFVAIVIAINDIQKRPDPFIIKHQSHSIVELFKILNKYKSDENYDKVLLQSINYITKERNDLNMTKEHFKIFDRKYLR